MTGTEENKQKQSIREIDSVVRHPKVQVKTTKDRMTKEDIIKYRVPEEYQEGVKGVDNTGRRAMYSKASGLMHLVNEKREKSVFEADQKSG